MTGNLYVNMLSWVKLNFLRNTVHSCATLSIVECHFLARYKVVMSSLDVRSTGNVPILINTVRVLLQIDALYWKRPHLLEYSQEFCCFYIFGCYTTTPGVFDSKFQTGSSVIEFLRWRQLRKFISVIKLKLNEFVRSPYKSFLDVCVCACMHVLLSVFAGL